MWSATIALIIHLLFKISPWQGVISDIKKRSDFYRRDWTNGFTTGFRILTPTTYIFFATALQVIVFGEQLHINTDGTFSAFDTLASSALCGIIHAIIGGQPLIILGIAEPTVYVYTDLYKFAKSRETLGATRFVHWAAWICVWTSLMLIAFAVLGGSSITKRFTRIVGELFEAILALLFVQQAIKGMVGEFKVPNSGMMGHYDEVALQKSWCFVNGFFGLLLCFGLLMTALKTTSAHTWRYGSGWMRSITSDYGVPLMVLLWTAISYTFQDSFPLGVPRRLQSPNAWEAMSGRWSIIKGMGEVPTTYIFAAILPAIIMTGLLIFDHSVAAQLAEQEVFNLQAPPAHHYDMLLLGFMVLICGLIGVPPCSGLVPQSPMHTKSLAKLNEQIFRKKLVEVAKKGLEDKVTLGELYGSMQEVYKDSRPNYSVDWPDQLKDLNELRNFKSIERDLHVDDPVDVSMFDPEKDVDALLPVTVNEQRLTNLLQAIMMGVCMAAMPLIRLVPVSVLWGYFFYIAFETLQGNQFCERLLLILTAPNRRYKVLEDNHASFMEVVPYRDIAAFTIFQLIFLIVCFGITWIPRVGVLFPLSVFVLVLIRQYILPRYFQAEYLWELDAAKYEQAPPIPHERALEEAEVHGLGKIESMRNSVSDTEILNDMTARGRGELKVSIARVEQLANLNEGHRISVRQRSKRTSHAEQSTRRISPTNEIDLSDMVRVYSSTNINKMHTNAVTPSSVKSNTSAPSTIPRSSSSTTFINSTNNEIRDILISSSVPNLQNVYHEANVPPKTLPRTSSSLSTSSNPPP